MTTCEEKVHNCFKFNAQQLDPITQQYYLRARYYNPVIGRFTQEDTYRGDGLNLYVYYANNPVCYVDPNENIYCEKAAKRIIDECISKKILTGEGKKILRQIHNKVVNALRNYRSKKWNIHGIKVVLDKKAMKHILQRHSPKYWDRSIKETQSFLDRSLSISDIQNIASEIIKQNVSLIAKVKRNGQIKGIVNSVSYTLGFKNFRIGQLFRDK